MQGRPPCLAPIRLPAHPLPPPPARRSVNKTGAFRAPNTIDWTITATPIGPTTKDFAVSGSVVFNSTAAVITADVTVATTGDGSCAVSNCTAVVSVNPPRILTTCPFTCSGFSGVSDGDSVNVTATATAGTKLLTVGPQPVAFTTKAAEAGTPATLSDPLLDAVAIESPTWSNKTLAAADGTQSFSVATPLECNSALCDAGNLTNTAVLEFVNLANATVKLEAPKTVEYACECNLPPPSEPTVEVVAASFYNADYQW